MADPVGSEETFQEVASPREGQTSRWTGFNPTPRPIKTMASIEATDRLREPIESPSEATKFAVRQRPLG